MPEGYFVKKIEKKTKGRFEVSLEGGEPLLLYGKELSLYHVAEETVLSAETYQRILNEVLNKRAAKRAMFLLQQQDRSEKNLMGLLKKNGYPAESIDYAISYVKKYHYLDDARFAENYIRFHQEKESRQALKQKLMQRQVPANIIESALDEFYSGDESEQIRQLLTKKKYDPETADQKEKQRIYAFLMRRGFSASEISRAMRIYEAE